MCEAHLKRNGLPGGGGTHLKSQHSGGRGRSIPVSLKPAWSTELAPGQLGLSQKMQTTVRKQTNQREKTNLFSR